MTNANDTKSTPQLPGCIRVTSITLFALTIIATLAFYWISRIPVFKDTQICAVQLQSVNDAIQRYYTKKGEYPERLEDLHPVFLADRKILHCPSDKSKLDTISYEYNRPARNSSDKTIILICRKHTLIKGQPPLEIRIQKNGNPVIKSTPYKTQGI